MYWTQNARLTFQCATYWAIETDINQSILYTNEYTDKENAIVSFQIKHFVYKISQALLLQINLTFCCESEASRINKYCSGDAVDQYK